ncbi:phosphoribosylamine--glycine ligase [Alicyclobacillus sp.]|uniref:phosphoribosylamine--glycine ligase n=1 Tax=Alicyclobacillus sp. TaxID=61169 RepID=UPI0025BA7DA8|nr:phosphoribosylamine--glycine ligase [Alicyclobacillus sp.]MCL6517416.1 phosphoribosylamine--glycine ligase [Alicyclobacillus sp.]
MIPEIPENPRVLVVGNGAREHTILWKLAQSRHRPVLFAAPGNAGTEGWCTPLPLKVDHPQDIVAAARAHGVHLVIVGPEAALSAGLADACEAAGIRVFGPTAAAARLETSKSFAKRLMQAQGVPTARFAVFEDAEEARDHIRRHGAPIVVKADGLAAGKGVVVAQTVDEAISAVDDMMAGGRFGQAGRRVVLEERMTGREVSMMFFVDRHTVVPMLPARDYKRVFDGDAGPNTGGMGALAPVPGFAEAGLVERVQHEIVRPVLSALAQQGIPYRGVLYAGLMLTDEGPKVVEFNCRFGDPETQVVLPLLQSDLLEIAWAVSEDRLADVAVRWSADSAVCVVLAAHGYPANPRTGDAISIHEDHLAGFNFFAEGSDRLSPASGEAMPSDRQEGARTGFLFHAGTARSDGRLVTAGGRVLSAVGVGEDLEQARSNAYRVADAVDFAGKHCRRDIAVMNV